MKNTAPSSQQLIELRRHRIAPGRRQDFADVFESCFPDACQQLGAVAFGHFFERERADCFTWLRGFPDLPARAAVNQALYDGPAWRAHELRLEGCIIGDDVLLLRPLYRDSALPQLRAVDPVAEPNGAQGIAVVQLFPVAPGMLDDCARTAETSFLGYTGAGVTEAAILASADQARPPGPGDATYLVWVGMLRDEAALQALRPRFDAAAATLAQAGLLAAPAELLVMDPGKRSRMRWLLAHAA